MILATANTLLKDKMMTQIQTLTNIQVQTESHAQIGMQSIVLSKGTFRFNALTRAMSLGMILGFSALLAMPQVAFAAGDDSVKTDATAELNSALKLGQSSDEAHAHTDDDTHEVHNEAEEQAAHSADDKHNENTVDDGHGHAATTDGSEVGGAAAGVEEEHGIELSAAQQTIAGIEVITLMPGTFSLDTVATATLRVDRDRTMALAPQLDVTVNQRHVVPGQQVEKGQPLLTLGGVAVAQAQADYINAAAELSRVKRMGSGAVSASRSLTARVDVELTRATLIAMQMSPSQIKGLRAEAIGSYQLLAPIAGRVQQDVAMLGQVIAGGTALMQITDESHLWVEAQLTPLQAETINIGSKALVRVAGRSIEATIIGRSHELNSVTRTEQVLLSLENNDYGIHAGQFVELYLPNAIDGGVVLPDAALTRGGDGDWQVFILDDTGFEAVEVDVVEQQRGMNLVRGLTPGSKIVVSGAFFLASELAKSGFDIHNH